MNDFGKLGMKKEIIEVLSRLKLTKPFEVQEKVIPLALSGKNLVFTSRTGSGKTLAYLLGNLSKIQPKRGLQMVVLVPTRELCIQVGKELTKVCRHLDIKVGMLYGGREIQGDYRTINSNNNIMVGTPGRLIVHINEKRVKVGDVKYLVYDEADQMLDHGFFDDCAYMKKRVAKDAQIILASATLTDQVEEFIEEEIVDFEFLEIGDLIPKNILQEKIYCDKLEKNEILLKLFKKNRTKQAILFCNTKEKAFNIAQFFTDNGFNSKLISGDLTQDERLRNLNGFKNGEIRILVATDIAARGIHIEQVDVVINYDVPTREELYVHRIGRTGRVDRDGYALTLVCDEDIKRFEDLQEIYELKVREIPSRQTRRIP